MSQFNRPLTYGEKAVGLSFNPSANPNVDKAKRVCADFIDMMNDIRSESADPEVKRMCSLAITDAQSAQMWGVKAITWSY